MTVTADLSLFVLCHSCCSSSFLRAGGAADASCVRSDARCVCPLAGSGNGPRGLLVLEALSRKTWLWNIERRDQQSPACCEGDATSITVPDRSNRIPQTCIYLSFDIIILC